MPAMQAKLARVRRILKRQAKAAWGKDYVPAIFATPAEAPRCSRPTILRPKKLGQRDMHLLSGVEGTVAILALFHPNVWDIHEQHMLSTEPTAHPLASHPSTLGTQLPRIEGTVKVANRLGKLSWHGKVYAEDIAKWVPDIYVGDLLLFCTDDAGPYCINGTVKATAEDFRHPGPRLHGKPRRAPSERTLFRHDLEAAYFDDVMIRTQRIAGDEIDSTLAFNLEHLFGRHARKVNLADEVREELLDAFNGAIGGNTSAFSLVRELAARFSAPIDEVCNVLYQGIWHRRLRVDLFSPIVIDKPLRREVRDPLDVYSSWFVRQ